MQCNAMPLCLSFFVNSNFFSLTVSSEKHSSKIKKVKFKSDRVIAFSSSYRHLPVVWSTVRSGAISLPNQAFRFFPLLCLLFKTYLNILKCSLHYKNYSFFVEEQCFANIEKEMYFAWKNADLALFDRFLHSLIVALFWKLVEKPSLYFIKYLGGWHLYLGATCTTQIPTSKTIRNTLCC